MAQEPGDRARERDACGVGFVARADGTATTEVVALALEALLRVRHRGAVAADGVSSDGAGLLLPIPRALLAPHLRRSAIDPTAAGLAHLFVRDDPGKMRTIVERACREEGIDVVAWREVPVEPSVLGDHASATMPRIVQALLGPPTGRVPRDRAAFRARRRIEAMARVHGLGCYVASCSFRTVSYKALVGADRLGAFYPDLIDPATSAPFAVFHQRFSTNTTPSWERAQPFRMLCHNGEINTIDGNLAHLRAREGALGVGVREEELLRPVADPRGSDSAILDETVELLTREGQVAGGGRDARHAVAMLVPAAWERRPRRGPRPRRLLPLPRVRDRAVGRSGGAGLHGRHRASERRWIATACARCGMPRVPMGSWCARARREWST